MGEAKRRRLAGAYPVPAVNIPRDIRDDIASVVRGPTIIDVAGGGKCFFRALLGKLTLRNLGLSAKTVLGGMLYQAENFRGNANAGISASAPSSGGGASGIAKSSKRSAAFTCRLDRVTSLNTKRSNSITTSSMR
jgi:hypothetical protein